MNYIVIDIVSQQYENILPRKFIEETTHKNIFFRRVSKAVPVDGTEKYVGSVVNWTDLRSLLRTKTGFDFDSEVT